MVYYGLWFIRNAFIILSLRNILEQLDVNLLNEHTFLKYLIDNNDNI